MADFSRKPAGLEIVPVSAEVVSSITARDVAPQPDLGIRKHHSRVGDAERNAIIDRLSAALGDGQLGRDHYDARHAAAELAVMQEDLSVLVSDLPVQVPPPVPPSASAGQTISRSLRNPAMAGTYAAASLVLAAVLITAAFSQNGANPHGGGSEFMWFLEILTASLLVLFPVTILRDRRRQARKGGGASR
jgi:hypothetical protein